MKSFPWFGKSYVLSCSDRVPFKPFVLFVMKRQGKLLEGSEYYEK